MPKQLPPGTPLSVCWVNIPHGGGQCRQTSSQPHFKAPNAHKSHRFLLMSVGMLGGKPEIQPPLCFHCTSGGAVLMVRLLDDKFWQAFGEALVFWGKELLWPQNLQMSPGHFHLPSVPLRQRVYEKGCYHHLHPAGKM